MQLEPKGLELLRNDLGQATVKWMKEIAQISQDTRQNYKMDNAYLQKGIWYAEDHLKACSEKKVPQMVAWIKKTHKQLIGHLPVDFFEKIPEQHPVFKHRTWHFLAKSNVPPSVALKATLVGLSIIECGMACQIARYGALLELFGEAKFNRLFGSEVGQRMNIGFRVEDELQPMRYFVDFTPKASEEVVDEEGNRPVKEGQLIAFQGVKEFKTKNVFSCWGGANAICSDATPGSQKFVTMGTGPDGKTEKKLNAFMVEKYNQLTDEDLFLLAPVNDPSTAMLKQLKAMEGMLNTKVQNPLYPAIATKAEGYVRGSIQDFIVEIIQDVIALPLEEVSMDFVKNHPLNCKRFEQ